jgi:Spy/CpxP family protein refolding chaperone
VSRIKLFLAVAALMIAGSLSVRAEDATTQPTTQESSTGKIPARFSKLDLTDDQKSKISDIHEKAIAQVKEIDKQEYADIDAVLTDDQKAELKKMDDDRKAELKAKRAEKKASKSENATTEKSD